MVNTLFHYYRDNVINYYRYRDSVLIRDNRFIVIIIIIAQHYLIVVIGQKSYGFLKFRALKINLAIGFIQKTHWNALVRL